MKNLPMFALLALAACGDPGGGGDANEFISRVVLTFTPPTSAALTFQFDDPDGDGGSAGTADPIMLSANEPYQVTVEFLNALETPPEDITAEVRDEGVEHQVFFTGSGVVGPASDSVTGPILHDYADTDSNGFPLGLTSNVLTSTGSGDLVVTLRHMPPEKPPGKSATTAADVAVGGFAAIGGSTDAQVTFTVTVP